ncbi:universal stress protein [Rhodopirellula sp. JC740]|uniref:Universal stress protein n=1 Tax=Rhodopirellula halodulae TaxID=2894198 RepID=A0ABS8NCS3_9BACT|nr:universal stress protein [Rhodopirellula sp. JC740]MCC9641348.1 universal stress protein [Rhodopirellula sp. JC740]
MDQSPDLDRDVDDSMRMFERAKVGSATPLTPIRPARLMLVLDGSPQDATSIATAAYFRETYNTETFVLDARDSAEPKDTGTEDAIQAARQMSGARAIARGEGEAFEAILNALKTHDVNLLIVPCPFGRSFERVGTDSVGTVMDVLLSRCPVPILVTRREDQDFRQCSQRILLMAGSECDVESRAAAWAFGLAAPDAVISLNLVVEKEHFENVRSILESLRPEESFDVQKLSDALAQSHAQLHSAMNATAREMKLSYSLVPQAGEVAPPNPLSDSTQQLLVLPLEVDDRFIQGFVHDRLRRSPHPLLIVPGHVLPE